MTIDKFDNLRMLKAQIDNLQKQYDQQLLEIKTSKTLTIEGTVTKFQVLEDIYDYETLIEDLDHCRLYDDNGNGFVVESELSHIGEEYGILLIKNEIIEVIDISDTGTYIRSRNLNNFETDYDFVFDTLKNYLKLIEKRIITEEDQEEFSKIIFTNSNLNY